MFGDGFIPAHAGKTYARMDARRPIGLIPAHAGKTRTAANIPPGDRAHPRSRGENLLITAATVISWGSSPLTRGKHQRQEGPERTRGLIPAHAGKTPWRM